MGSKKVVLFGLAVVAIVVLGILIRPKGTSVQPLRFCTWSNYYPESFIEEFTKKTGIPVEMSYISSNEELLAKFKAGSTGYDLIQPSDYLVAQMIKLGMLAPIDTAQVPNLSHIDDFYRNLSYDPGMKYSIPFTWGTTGIAINVEKVKIPGEVGWDMLFKSPDPKHTALLDDAREVFGGVLMWHGHNSNTTDVALLNKTKAEVMAIKNRVLMFNSEPRALLEKGEVNIAQIFSFDGIGLARTNSKIKYFIPKEGATIYTDNFSIPKDATMSKEAHLFINHFLDPEVGRRMAMENGLATPNKTVRESLPKEITDDATMYPPPDVMKRLHFLDDIGETLSTLSRLWTEVKSS